jgi:hypothetical protein
MAGDVRLPVHHGGPENIALAVSTVLWRRRSIAAGILPLVILMAAVASDRFGIRVRGVNLRFELLTAALLLVYVLVTQGLTVLRRIGSIEWLLAGWLLIGAISSAFLSPAPATSLRLTLLLAGLLALYAVTIAIVRSPTLLVRAAEVWVAVGGVVSLIALIDAVLYILFEWRGGISFEGFSLASGVEISPKVHATMWEPNILGSYLLTVWGFALGLSLRGGRRDPRRGWLTAVFIGTGIGLVICSTRAIWVIAPIVMLAACLAVLRVRLMRLQPLLALVVNPTLLGLAIGLGVLLLMSDAVCPAPAAATTAATPSPSAVAPGAGAAPSEAANPFAQPGCVRSGSAFFSHARGLASPGSQSSFVGRAQIARLAFEGWLHSPLLGRGSGSYILVFGPAGGGWIGNLELHILFDTGFLGFLCLLGAAVVAGRMAFRALRQPINRWTDNHFVLVGALFGAASLLATYQLTEGTWLGFTWVFFALLVAAARFASGALPRA